MNTRSKQILALAGVGCGAFLVGVLVPRPWVEEAGRAEVTGGAGTTVVVASGSGTGAGTKNSGAGVTSRGGGSDRDLGGDVVRPLVGIELEELATEAFRDPSHLKRSLAFAKLLEGLTAENAPQIMEMMREMGAGGDQWNLFKYAWGAADPVAAITHAEGIEDGRRRHDFMEGVVSGWASEDPDAAIAYVESVEDDRARQGLLGDLIAGRADSDADRASAYVYKLAAEGNEYASRYMDSVVGEVLRRGDVLAAAAWADRLGDGSLKGVALDRVAGRYVNENPEEAAAWASQYASMEFGVRVIEEVGDEWAERDPVAAVKWLDGLPAGPARDEGMRSALNEWTERDPMGASKYLAAMPQSPTRDRAVSGFVGELAESDPVSAVAWAETIDDQKLREETLTRAARDWFRRDAPAAATWLEKSGLPLEAQERVLAPPERRGWDRRRRG